MKILIIEDEISLAKNIQQYLEAEGNICEVVTTFDEAWMKAGIFEYDCVLVDITLPGGTGLDIIRELKKQRSSAGIIIISAKNSVDDKVTGLHLGSDDYITKPFHLSELNARIQALIRRRQFGGNAVIEFNEIKVFPEEKRVLVNDQTLTLTNSEYQLLMYFLANKNRVLTKENIAEHLLGDQAENLDSLTFIYAHVKNLRRKLLEKNGEDYIKAVYGIGYKFTEA